MPLFVTALIKTWFEWSLHGGYLALFVLMALESSLVPIPSELIIPPAAYWAAKGRMEFWLVVIVGTAGSWFGAAVNYGLARWLGHPFIRRYGKYFLLPEPRVEATERWLLRHASVGILAARLLPVMRHLISIPAGIIRMPFAAFSGMTLLGSFIWCAILTWIGEKILGDHPDLLENPNALLEACRAHLHLLIPAVLIFGVVYYLVLKKLTPHR